MDACTLCPRMCGVNRAAGEKGYCGMDATIRAARAALHMWEEPCISGTQGSGAVFFSGCSLRCIFCQNFEIAEGNCAKEISGERLSEIFLELQEQGAANINLVTAAHYVPAVIESLKKAKAQGMDLPVIYNSSGYERVETVQMLEEVVDVWLPDFKYMDSKLAFAYSRAKDYPEVTYEHMLVDNCAMQLVKDPKQFDVILTENMFGDILSDEASMVTGSIGMLSSASLNDTKFGLYEPSGGSAPDIAGKGIANPIATILSAAMMLRYTFDLDKEADAIEAAVKQVLKDGYRTIDIMPQEEDKRNAVTQVGTAQMGDLICERI